MVSVDGGCSLITYMYGKQLWWSGGFWGRSYMDIYMDDNYENFWSELNFVSGFKAYKYDTQPLEEDLNLLNIIYDLFTTVTSSDSDP